MTFIETVAAVVIGNLLFSSIVWGLWMLHKHDTDAPWVAFLAVLIPLGASFWIMATTGATPPQLDALVPQ